MEEEELILRKTDEKAEKFLRDRFNMADELNEDMEDIVTLWNVLA